MENQEKIVLYDGTEIASSSFDKSKFVKLSGKWYPRYSGDIVKVEGRFYRKESKLVVPVVGGGFALKSKCVKIEGTSQYGYHPSHSTLTKEINGKFYHASIHSFDKYGNVGKASEFFTDRDGEKAHFTLKCLVYEAIDNAYFDCIKKVETRNNYIKISDYYNEGCAVFYNKSFPRYAKIDEFTGEVSFGEFVNRENYRRAFSKAQMYHIINEKNQSSSLFYHPDYDGIKKIRYNGRIYDVLCTNSEKDKIEATIKDSEKDLIKRQNDSYKNVNSDNDGENELEIVAGSFSSFESRKFGYTGSNSFEKTLGKKFSFGVEMETAKGMISPEEYNERNMKCVRDGSVSGGEYVTGKLQGDAGVEELRNICRLLSSNCLIDNKCGLHVHIGTESRMTRAQSLRLLKVGIAIEKSIFAMLPNSRRGNNYCRSLDEMRKNAGFPDESSVVCHVHEKNNPEDGLEDREIARYSSSRYTWINFNNMFSRSGRNTIEFRPHSPSTNFTKIFNWVKICMAIVDVATDESIDISGVKSIKDVVQLSYKNDAMELLEYIDYRTEYFKTNKK